MPEIRRLTECSDWPELDFVEREATPEPAMKLGIQLHLAGLWLADTVPVRESLGVNRCHLPRNPSYSSQRARTRMTSRLMRL